MSAWDIFVQQFVAREGYLTVLQGLLNTVIIAVFGLLIGFVLGSILPSSKLFPPIRTLSQ